MTSLEQAQRYFVDRGVHEETYKRHQIEIVLNPSHDQLVGWLGVNSYCLDAAIVFPNLVPNPDDLSIGIHNYYVRCFPPPVGSDGKERKFLCTLGSTYRPYALPPVWDVAYEIDQPIYIVEKQTAALLLQQNGLHAIALDGTWGAAAKKVEGERVELHPVLAEFHWTGRPVYLCFDSDFRTRQSVLWGLIRAYILFSIAGATVRLFQWDLQFKGLEDLIAAKAGMDSIKQHAELDLLMATVSGLSASKAAKTWIVPQYRGLFEREMAVIRPSIGERSMLADCIHEALGTTAGDLKKIWGVCAKEQTDAEEKVDGLEQYFNSIIPWPAPVPLSEILWETYARVARYNFTQDFYKVMTTCWAGVTYVFEESPFLPLLIFTSPKEESGKTSHMVTLVWLVYRPVSSSLISAAGAHRWLEQYKGTIWVDEVKSIADNPIMVALLNLGFNNSGHVVDTAVVRRWDPETKTTIQFRVNFMKMMAGIGSFLTEDTISRSLVIPMQRGLPHELDTIEDYVFIVPDEFMETVRKWHRWREENLSTFRAEVLKTMREMPKEIRGRKKQKFASLFTLGRLAGDQWYYLIEQAARKILAVDTPSADEKLHWRLLRDMYFIAEYELRLKLTGKPNAILTHKKTNRDFIPTDKFLKALRNLPESPWKTCGKFRRIIDENILFFLLREYRLKAEKLNKGLQGQFRGLYLDTLFQLFERYRSPSDKSPFGDPDSPGEDDEDNSGGCPKVNPNPPTNPPSSEEKFSESPEIGLEGGPAPYRRTVAEQVVEYEYVSTGRGGGSQEEDSVLCQHVENQRIITPRYDDTGSKGGIARKIPPSTPQAPFCTPSHPELFVFADLETFRPYEGDYPQPSDKTVAQLLRKKNKGEAHPWAKDPRRCVLRFLTIHDTGGTFGPEPLTIDFQANPELPANVLDALANRTIVGHNLDFDITILRRYGIPVSSSVIDTMLASRLLGMGKEKFKVPETAYCDLSEEELDEPTSSEMDDPNPVDNDLVATVRRYLGIKMEKATTKLGGSDWGRSDISNDQFIYMVQDVAHLPALWEALERELREAQLDRVFAERMEFLPHLNQIKMTGNPVDPVLCEADHKSVTAEKEAVREELCGMFADYRAPIPKSRLKTVKVQVESGKFKRVPGPTEEEFSPSNRDHVIGALAFHGIYVDNIREATLRKIDSPECRLFLNYFAAKKRLNAIKAILRSIFPDGRVRAQSWNQLAARTGRIISSEPNLQQVPKNWRTAFRVDPPKIWLKPDLSLIEVVILAVVTGDPGLIDLLRRGEDVYVLVASRLFDVQSVRKEEEGCVTEDLRDQAKPVVLGTNYGLTIWGLCRRFREEFNKELSLEEAQEFFDTFFGMFPGVAEYQAKAAEDALTADCVRTAGGQRRWLPPLLESDQEDNYWPSFERRKKILMNTPIQGGQADVLIRAVNKFMPKLPKEVEVVNLVFDEVDLIVTPETLSIAVEVIGSAFREAFAELYGNVLIPNIKFSKGSSWGELQELPK